MWALVVASGMLFGCESSGGEEAESPQTDSVVSVGPGPAAEADFRVLTYNVQLLFDTTCDSGECSFGDFERVLSTVLLDNRARTIAEAVSYIDPDVVLLQEVESGEALAAVADALGPDYVTSVMGDSGYPASIDVAVLSRLPLLEVVRHGDEPISVADGGITYFTREVLEVHLDAAVEGEPEERIIVFCVHFRSKNNDDPAKRLAEATATRELMFDAMDRHPDSLVVLGGDLNDTPGSPPLAALEEGGVLFRLGALLGHPEDATYTQWGEPRALDHLYMPAAQQARYVADSVKVWRAGNGGLGDSDHAALAADFTRQ